MADGGSGDLASNRVRSLRGIAPDLTGHLPIAARHHERQGAGQRANSDRDCLDRQEKHIPRGDTDSDAGLFDIILRARGARRQNKSAGKAED